MNQSKAIFILLFVFSFTCLIVSPAYAREITIGVVSDGPSPYDSIVSKIKKELERHPIEDTTIKFKITGAFNGQWQVKKIKKALKKALADREVDIVLTTGFLGTMAAAKKSMKLSKPVVSSVLQPANIFDLPYKDTKSQKDNFIFLLMPERSPRDIEVFKDLIGFDTLHILVTEADTQLLDYFKELLVKYEEELGVKLVLLPVSPDIDKSLANMDQGVQAIYITLLPQIDADKRKKLIDAINAKGIPTFSGLGYSDVEQGVLMAITPDVGEAVVRRVAVNLTRLIKQEKTKVLPVLLSVNSKLLLNAETARQIDYSPSFNVLIYADILHKQALRDEASILGVLEVFEMALCNNTSLLIKDSQLESVKQSQYIARGSLLPQLEAVAGYRQIDSDRARALGPTLPHEQSIAGLRVRQIIFDDKLISDFRASLRDYQGSVQDREAVRLDTLTLAGQAFFSFALAIDLYRIEAENVKVTEDNLELAKLRYDIGYSGKDEIFRWEAELAQQRSDLLTARSDAERQRIALNQVLGTNQDARWIPEDVHDDIEDFWFFEGKVGSLLTNLRQLDKFQEEMVEFAFSNSPEIKFVQKQIEAQKINLGQLKRKWVLPTISAGLDYNYELDRSGPLIPGTKKESYTVTMAATYPLFEGGNKYYDIKKADADLEALNQQKKLVQELIEQGTRTAISELETSIPSIELSIDSAKNSRKNLDVVQEKYLQGIVNVTDLLDAQRQSFTADRNVAIYDYRFLIDLINFQRSISWFEYEKSQGERDDFIEMIRTSVH